MQNLVQHEIDKPKPASEVLKIEIMKSQIKAMKQYLCTKNNCKK